MPASPLDRSEGVPVHPRSGGTLGRIEINTKVRRARRLLGAALGRPLIGPQVVSLETTHYCNLRCSFCESHGNLLTAPITADAGVRRRAGA